MQQAPNNVGDILKQLQGILTRQPTGIGGPLVTIGEPTLLAGGNTGTISSVSTGSGSTSSRPGSVQISAASSRKAPSQPSYSYKVKIINPTRKSDVIVRHLNDCSVKFESITALRVKLIESFRESVPNTINFNLGYFEGSQQAKIWLVVPDDLKTMYQKYPQGGAINLWCDARCDETEVENVRKRKRDSEVSKRQNIEENEKEVEDVYKKLLDKHGSKWDTPRLRLWARCICSDQHKDYEEPPDLPAFKGPEPKKRKESLSDALAGAAVAFATAMSGSKDQLHSTQPQRDHDSDNPFSGPAPAVSPGKTVELRMKNYQQLRFLQQLFEDGILDEKEFTEQKGNILEFLHRIK